MMTNPATAIRHSILGALVADAAALGLHWLYDQSRVAQLAGDTPEFTTTTESDYQGVPAYFAHAAKSTGDFSQYGEQAMVMLKSLAENSVYQKSHYEQTFRATFGYGGSYVGYIDRPTRDTLDTIAGAEEDAIASAKAQPFPGTPADQQAMINKVLANLRQHKGAALQKSVEEAVRITHDDDAMVEYALSLIEPLSATAGYHGAHDDQLPAISKLPALIALHHDSEELGEMVESAVRVTNNHPLSVECGRVMMQALKHAIAKQSIDSAIASLDQAGGDRILPIINAALARKNEPSTRVVADIGMACNLRLGMPGAFHILSSTSTYKDAIRTNILAGGDSCGRAIIIGAIAGAVYGADSEKGIPAEWIKQLNRLPEINNYLNKLGAAP